MEVSSGMPQGSVLSPYLFAARMGSWKPTLNDAEVFKYADDVFTAIVLVKHSNIDDLLEKYLHDTQVWCLENGLSLNREKTKV